VLLAQPDDAGAPPVSLLHQTLGHQNVQSLTNRTLGHAKLSRPGSFHDPVAGRDSAVQNLLAKLLGQVLLDERACAFGKDAAQSLHDRFLASPHCGRQPVQTDITSRVPEFQRLPYSSTLSA